MAEWAGAEPKECQLCLTAITEEFVDGAVLPSKKWAILCIPCHRLYGIGLGAGRGQLYKKGGKRWKKEER